MGAPGDEERPAVSAAQEAYFQELRRRADAAYDAARRARALRFDPVADVEVVLAEDLAARVEAQAEVPGLADLVRKLTRELGSRELVALEAAKRIVRGELQEFPGNAQAIDKAVRAGLSILTEGVVVAPLEGIAEVRLGRNPDGSDYVDLYFAGPIRAAGGGAQAMSVLIADVVRRELGVGRYRPTEPEIERYREEIPSYKRAANLQYTPTVEEIDAIVRNCPICINGEGTEKEEITGHRDLPRVETNKLRGGACLVIAEGLCLKAPKLLKHVKNLGLEDWGFLDRFAQKKVEPAEEDQDDDEIPEIEVSEKYIKDLIGGRPVFAHPSRRGAFRLRYGRAPTAGLAATAISPVTMHALDDFLAVGTQIKIERPGKGTIATPCDALEGPTLLLDNGDLVRVDRLDEWKAARGRVRRITDLGEILIPYGEFLENNQPLADSSYVHEWWIQDLEAAAGPEAAEAWQATRPDYTTSLDLSRRHGVPIHPDHTLLWHDLDDDAFERLRDGVIAHGDIDDRVLTLPDEPDLKHLLIQLNCTHTRRDGRLRLEQYGRVLLDALGLEARDGGIGGHEPVPRQPDARFPVVARVSAALGVPVKPRSPTRIGARMGRPEKADARKMNPPVHGLFPVGDAGGNQRKLVDALKANQYSSAVGRRRCLACGRESYRMRCLCGGGTDAKDEQPTDRKIGLKEDAEAASQRLGLRKLPDIVKGVKGLMSSHKWPEPLEKGVLRALHEIYVFKDGTVRFDMTDAPLTHFTPADIGTPIARLRELGYTTDAGGQTLEHGDQLVEMRVQDMVISRAGGHYLLRAAKFVDDLLTKYYGLEPFYAAERIEDLVGHLVVGLAPHTSAGVLGRIVGFTTAQVGWAHPYFHAGKRRNCLAGDTQIRIHGPSVVGRVGISSLYEQSAATADIVDSIGTRRKTPDTDIHVTSVDPKTGRIRRRRVTGVYRVPAPGHLVEVTTHGGRVVRCSAEHRFLVRRGRGFSKIPAGSLTAKDHVVATPTEFREPNQAPFVLAGDRPGQSVSSATAWRESEVRGDVMFDPVRHVRPIATDDDWLYDLEVEHDHTYATEDGAVVSNCDGDEDAIMLLMDCFLNFSRSFVPDRRGGLMDLPLVLTTRLDPNEIDKEAHNLDCAWSYPRAFYEATERHAHPKEVLDLIDIAEKRLGTPAQYEGIGVTHTGSSIHQGPVSSSYKTLGAMLEKMSAQLDLADRIRAVDAPDVADRVISTHLLPDLLGNLKAFTRQKVRCTKCNAKYRRVPLSGLCTNRPSSEGDMCGNSLTLTVHEKSVKKYLQIVQDLAQRYELPAYTLQRIQLVVRYMEDAFAPEKYVTPKLGEFSS